MDAPVPVDFSEVINLMPYTASIVHDNGVVWHVSDGFCDIFGYTQDDLLGADIFELGLFDIDDIALIQHRIADDFAGTYEVVGVRKNGEKFPLDIVVKTSEWNGKKLRCAYVRDLSDVLSSHVAKLALSRELNVTLIETIKALANALEARDPYTSGHETNVAVIAKGIGQALGMDDHDLQGLELGALIHDIGKIAVPAEILSKPGRLLKEEFALIQLHPERGAQIIQGLALPWPVARMIGEHHERLDGSGYPKGLKSDQICREAKIIAVADTFEAVAAHRPYRASLGFKKALAIINEEKGKTLDPEIVDVCTDFVIASDQFGD